VSRVVAVSCRVVSRVVSRVSSRVVRVLLFLEVLSVQKDRRWTLRTIFVTVDKVFGYNSTLKNILANVRFVRRTDIFPSVPDNHHGHHII
jgi:hypothetical protein